jgi:GntR family transcriptional repressor for pyruvate dehydrogenase complex
VEEIAKGVNELFLKPLEAKNKVELVIERIVDAVLDGTLEAGSYLPSERDFAERLGVSRAIIREALSALQVVGLIERRSGSGSFISPVSNVSVLKARALSVLSSTLDPYMVLQARAYFEPAISELVIEFATEDDLEAIKRALSLMDEACDRQDWDSYFDADRGFHMAIAMASHNTCIIQALEPLLSQMRTPLWQTLKRNYFLSSMEDVVALEESHKGIYVAIKDRNVKALKEEMEKHFGTLCATMKGGGSS